MEKENLEAEKKEKPKKEKKELTDKQKKLIVYAIIGILVIGVIVLYFASKKAQENEKTDTEKAIEYVRELGKDFYETYYYPQLAELKENEMIEDIPTFLANFTDTGISVSLNVVTQNHFRTEEAINKEIGDYKCDFDDTKVIIYPVEPYEKTSYKIAPMLSCKNLKEEEDNN